MVVRLRLPFAVKVPVKVPFTYMTGVISLFTEKFRQGYLALSQVAGVASGNPAPDSITVGGASSENGGSRWRADSAGRVALGKANTLGGKLVEVWRLDDFVAVASQVSPPHVIHEENDNVGRFRAVK